MDQHTEVEQQFWGDCTNTLGEEMKQLVYAKRMGLSFHNGSDAGGPYIINMTGKAILDIGGGPVSLLLKCRGLRTGIITDPLAWPRWVYHRYEEAGLICFPVRGEDATPEKFG